MDKIQQEVDWMILIYANGSNELEPEMRQVMSDAEKVGIINMNINIFRR